MPSPVTGADVVYSPQDISNMFGVSRRTVYKWLNNGTLGSIKLGTKLRFVTQAHLDTFIRASQRTVYRQVEPRSTHEPLTEQPDLGLKLPSSPGGTEEKIRAALEEEAYLKKVEQRAARRKARRQ